MINRWFAGVTALLSVFVFNGDEIGWAQSSGTEIGAQTRATYGWTQFRGPAGDGVADSDQVTVNLDPRGNAGWRTPLPGVGWSSPVTDGKVIWITSAIVTEASPAQRRKRLAGVQFAMMKDVAGSVELHAIAVDAASGELLIDRPVATVSEPNPVHPMNSYASPTPVIHDGRVICHFGGYGTWCLNASTGETVWKQRLVVDDSVGPGSSPIIVDELVLLVCDGIDQQFVAALSLQDGTVVWKTPRPPMRTTNGEFKKAYSTPLVIDVEGKKQAVVPGAQWIVAYEPTTGREIWRVDHGDGFSTTPMPIYDDGRVVFSTGFMAAELVAVDPRGQGDVTATHVRWRQQRSAPTKPSPISDGELVYMISDDGILSAVELDGGSTVWRKRIGGTFSASPLRSGDHVFIANHEGELTVFATGREYREIGRFDFGEQIMASPVPVRDDLLIRTKAAIYRFSRDAR